jgi:hypothetical protein
VVLEKVNKKTVGGGTHGFDLRIAWEHSAWCSQLKPLHVRRQAGEDTIVRRHHQS